MVRLVQTMHLSYVKMSTISKWTKPNFHLSLVTKESHWVHPKQFYAYGMSVQTVHLSCIDTNTISKRTKMRFQTTHVTYEFYWVCPKLLMSLWYVQCKQWTYPASRLALSPNVPNSAPPEPHPLAVPSGASKMIYKPMVRLTQTEHVSCTDSNTVSKHIETISMPMVYLVQTMQLSCTNIKTISKRTKTRFHTTHVTYEFHRVRPKLFYEWMVRSVQPCTHLVLRFVLF
jgi:hypothetical protein